MNNLFRYIIIFILNRHWISIQVLVWVCVQVALWRRLAAMRCHRVGSAVKSFNIYANVAFIRFPIDRLVTAWKRRRRRRRPYHPRSSHSEWHWHLDVIRCYGLSLCGHAAYNIPCWPLNWQHWSVGTMRTVLGRHDCVLRRYYVDTSLQALYCLALDAAVDWMENCMSKKWKKEGTVVEEQQRSREFVQMWHSFKKKTELDFLAFAFKYRLSLQWPTTVMSGIRQCAFVGLTYCCTSTQQLNWKDVLLYVFSKVSSSHRALMLHVICQQCAYGEGGKWGNIFLASKIIEFNEWLTCQDQDVNADSKNSTCRRWLQLATVALAQRWHVTNWAHPWPMTASLRVGGGNRLVDRVPHTLHLSKEVN